MFNFDFFELMVIGVVALVVIGPERLPTVARSAGRWVGRFQRFMNSLAEDLNKELEIDKLKEMHRQAQQELEKANQKAIEESSKAQMALSEAETTVNAIGNPLNEDVRQLDASDAGTPVKEPSAPVENTSNAASSNVQQDTSPDSAHKTL